MTTPSAKIPKLEVGRVVDRYTVLGRLGHGGVAQVYKVRHNTLGTLHALKVLRRQVESMRERLVQEGQVQAKLKHPNVLAVTDVLDVDGDPGLVMDYIEGPALDTWLADHRPTVAEAEAIFRGIVAGVGKAHKLGRVHRDLKPANVLLATDDDGNLVPKVADFGLAKILDDDEEVGGVHTHTGTTMGTPAYMAPEQVRDSKSVDERADIFALGCILYELCTGVSPFYHPDLFEIFSALASGSFTPPEALEPGLPPRIVAAIKGCLTTAREHRIESCAALIRVLDGGKPGEQPSSETFDLGARPDLRTDEVSRALRSANSGADSIGGSLTASDVSRARAGSRPAPAQSPRSGLWMVGGLGLAGIAAIAFGVGGSIVGAGGVLWYAYRAHEPGHLGGPPTVVSPAPAEPSPTQPSPVTPVSPVSPVEPPPAPAEPSPASPGPAPAAPGPHAPQPDAKPAAKAKASVSATGDADQVWLEGPAGRVELGDVSPGDYRVMAGFKGQAAQPAGRITVREGTPVVLVCSAAFQVCQAR